MIDGGRGDVVVRNLHLLAFDVENGLVGVRPHPVQALDGILSIELRVLATGMDMIHRFFDRHLGDENLIVAPGDLQEAVTVIGLEHEPMPRIRRDRQQSIDPIVGFGDVVLRH